MERIQRIRVAPQDGVKRVEIALRGRRDLPATLVLQAVEQLRETMGGLSITVLRITVMDNAERIES